MTTAVPGPAVLLDRGDAELLARLAALGVQLLRQSHGLDAPTAAAAERLGRALADLEADRANDDRWIPTAEAARLLGVTAAAVRQRVRRGTLEARHVGRSLLVRP